MYAAIAKAMVRSSRMRSFPTHIPASQSQTLPPQRREPASASIAQIDILYLSFILFDFLIYADSRGEGVEFPFSFSLLLAYPTFFYASFRRVGRFRFSGVKRQGLGQTRFYGENTTCNEMEVWRLSSKRLAAPTFFVLSSTFLRP